MKPIFTRPVVIALILIGGLLALVLAAGKRKYGKTVYQTQSVNHARQIGLALLDFQTEYGRFPDASTEPAVIARTGSPLRMTGRAANDYFRQILAAGITDSEVIFYAKGDAYSHPPDNVSRSTATALAPGEVSLGYLTDAGEAIDPAGDHRRPLVCWPLASDGHTVSDRHFDPRPADGKAVLLLTDNSVVSVPIDRNRNAIHRRKPLLATGPDSVWAAHEKPVIAPPLPGPDPRGAWFRAKQRSLPLLLLALVVGATLLVWLILPRFLRKPPAPSTPPDSF